MLLPPQEFSQKHVGWQLLPAQIFTASDVPLNQVDFSHNSMRRLAERLFDGGFERHGEIASLETRFFTGLEDTLEEIYLSHNLLGDNLSPVFSTSEFQNLRFLRVLDLSHNGLTGIAKNLIKGCEGLKVGNMSEMSPNLLPPLVELAENLQVCRRLDGSIHAPVASS